MTDNSVVPIVGFGYFSLYFADLPRALEFYSSVFGEPASKDEGKQIFGWKMGTSWLTLLPSKIGTSPITNPCNAEFAVQVSTSLEVDVLHKKLLSAGATEFMPPHDTSMYEPMRFSCVDDVFGVRIDVYCPLINAA